MAKDWTRDISDQKNVELELNLAEIFAGYYVPDSGTLRHAVGQAVIDIIRNRTKKDERSWTGASFKNYSADYADSIEFKAYGKSKTEPNLTQSGDMLGLMTILPSKDPGIVSIGWTDSLQSEKAHGHITGNIGVKRDFFGLNDGEINELRKKFKDQLAEAPEGGEDATTKFEDFASGRTNIARAELDAIVESFFSEEE